MKQNGRKRSLLNRARTNARRLFQQEGDQPGSSIAVGSAPETLVPDVSEASALAVPEAPLRLEDALAALRRATLDTPYEGVLWIVGGYVRDKMLGLRQDGDDVDLVTQANALELANLLNERGVTEIAPVVYPRFGTAMVWINGCDVELVTARRESYDEHSRKPAQVQPATLEQDALRRDFTINTLMENLHSGEVRDPTGSGEADLCSGILRTPLPPAATFADDPLRMLRAVRFAGKLNFQIAPDVWDAICDGAGRLGPPKVSMERVRDEFAKMLMQAAPSQPLELLRRSDLLSQFAPELCSMVGVTQNEFHAFPVWDHTLLALDNLVAEQPQAGLLLRLATLLHDVGKPGTRSVDAAGRVHFYGHEDAGAAIARTVLNRLKFSLSDIDAVVRLVAQHMRIGEYRPDQWTDAAVRRLVRDSGSELDGLFALHRADVSALSEEHHDISRAALLRERIDDLERAQPSSQITSPLTGEEIMDALNLRPGPTVGRWKEWLLSEVLEGRLGAEDKRAAALLLRQQALGDMPNK